MNIKICIDDDKGKIVNLELNNVDEKERNHLVSSVFQTFGFDVINGDNKNELDDEKDEKLEAVRQMYLNFNEEINSGKEVENHSIEEVTPFSSPPSSPKNLNSSEGKDKDFIVTGIKYRKGVPTYRLRYECPECANKDTLYIEEDVQEINCRNCNKLLNVYNAARKGFPHRDSFGNFFRAGVFQDFNEIAQK